MNERTDERPTDQPTDRTHERTNRTHISIMVKYPHAAMRTGVLHLYDTLPEGDEAHSVRRPSLSLSSSSRPSQTRGRAVASSPTYARLPARLSLSHIRSRSHICSRSRFPPAVPRSKRTVVRSRSCEACVGVDRGRGLCTGARMNAGTGARTTTGMGVLHLYAAGGRRGPQFPGVCA